MKVCLAGTSFWQKNVVRHKIPSVLESYYTLKEWQWDYFDRNCEFVMLDSGAFTFMNGTGSLQDIDGYIKRYGDAVRNHFIKYFFELDIDSVVGYSKVLDARKRLEDVAGAQCIPVWHNTRGAEEWLRMCEEYPYVAIGGLVQGNGEYARKHWDAFSWFIREAHRRGAKVHGLGFTSMDGLKKYHFDSVDSTSWTAGERFGTLYRFDGERIVQMSRPSGARGKKFNITEHNLCEWLKFCRYAELNL